MLDYFKNSATELWIGTTTFCVGLFSKIFSSLPIIHDVLGTLSMLLGCVACAIVIVVNYRQAKINGMIEKDLEAKHGKL